MAEPMNRIDSNRLFRINRDDVEVIRHSIFLDRRNHPLPMSQVMPKYIPKEPIKVLGY